MAGAGTEVGRISIKVTPDTDDFRRKLKQQLEAIERSLKGQIPISVDLDAGKGKAQLAAALAAMRAQARAGVKVPVTADSQGVDGVWKNIKSGLGDISKFGREAASGIREYHREIKRLTLEQQKAAPLLNHDVANLRSHGVMLKRGKEYLREFNDALKQQQQWLRQANPAMSENAARWKSWGMAIRDSNNNLTNGFSKFKAAFKAFEGGDNGSSFFARFIPGMGKTSKALDSASDSAGRSTRTFLGLSRIGWIVGAVFAGAAPAVGLISGLIAGLPSLMMIAGAAAGAIALGMDGIKAAAATVAPQWEAMRGAISQRFQDGLTPLFSNLAEKVFPVMETGMLQVTDGLVNMAGGITKTLTSAQGMTQLSTIFQGIGGFFTDITPAMSQFTNSFLTLGAAGAQSMGHLTGFISQFATQWQTMVDKVVGNGTFDKAMQGMSTALSGFTGLFTTLMESGLGAMAKLGEPLNNMFSGLGNLLSSAMPALTSFAGGVGNVIGNLANGLAPAFAALTPVVDALMPTFASLATTLGQTLSQAVVALAPALTQIAQVMGPVLTTAVTALAPILTQVAQTLGTVLLSAVQALAPVMPQLTAAFTAIAQAVSTGLAIFLPVVAQLFAQLLPVVIQLVPSFLQLVQAIAPLIPAVFQVAASFLKLLVAITPVLSVFANLASLLVQVIAQFVQWGATIVTSVQQAFTQLVDIVTNSMSQFVNAITEKGNQAIEWVRGLGGKIASACSNFGTILVNAGKALMNGLLDGIKAGWEAVKGFVGSIAGWIKEHKGPIPYDKKVLIPNGEALMEGLNTGLENGFDGTLDNVKGMAKAIFEAVKEVFGSANGLALNFNFGGGGSGGGGGLVGGLGAMSAGMANVTTGAKDFQSNLAEAVNPSKQLTADAKAQVTEYSRQLALLEQRRKELELMRINDKDNAAIKQELELIRQKKLAIGLEKDKLTYAQKYEGTVSSTNDQYQEQIKKLTNMPVDFAKTTAQTALGDIGIPGQGALGALANYGMDLGSQFVFNVSNVDEAMAVKDRETNRQAAGIVGR